jgi:F-type H+-transporting ATPase subunit gamma
MQRAEKNIDELLENLSQTFHRLRQSSIDEELFDVVSGYESLAKRRKAQIAPHLNDRDRARLAK